MEIPIISSFLKKRIKKSTSEDVMPEDKQGKKAIKSDKRDKFLKLRQEVQRQKQELNHMRSLADKKTTKKKLAPHRNRGSKNSLTDNISGGGYSTPPREVARTHGVNKSRLLKFTPWNTVLTFTDMFQMAHVCAEIRGILYAHRRAVFRKGLKWVPKYNSRCSKCGSKFKKLEPYTPCPICNKKDIDPVFEQVKDLLVEEDADVSDVLSKVKDMDESTTYLIPPDKDEYKSLEKLFNTCNERGQTISDVDKQRMFDLDVVDRAYYILQWEYYDVDLQGAADGKRLNAIYRGNPIFIRPVIDQFYTSGGQIWRCLVHNNEVKFSDKYSEGEIKDDWKHPTCDVCGRPMHDVKYIEFGWEYGSPKNTARNRYYIEGEVIPVSHYGPDNVHGMPPMIASFSVGASIMAQTFYIRDVFIDRRLPYSMLVSHSANPEKAEKRFEELEEKIDVDPSAIWHVSLDSSNMLGGEGKMEKIDLMPALNEMEYTPAREEHRRVLADMWGMFYSDMTQGTQTGANEGPRIQPDPSEIDEMQKTLNKSRNRIVEMVDDVNGWEYVNISSEERDVMKNLQIEQIKWEIAQMANTVDFETVRDANGDIKQVKKRITSDSMGMLKDLLLAYFNLKNSVGQQKQEEDGETPSTSDSTSPEGGPTRQTGFKEKSDPDKFGKKED